MKGNPISHGIIVACLPRINLLALEHHAYLQNGALDVAKGMTEMPSALIMMQPVINAITKATMNHSASQKQF